MLLKTFKCLHCRREVPETGAGTHRNHCPYCLWSKHVDAQRSGDRKSSCQSPMRPLGLTFKKEGFDKRGKKRQGEIMLVQECLKNDKISINRLAADDDPKSILDLFDNSLNLDQGTKEKLEKAAIELLTNDDREQIMLQLFGKKSR